MRIDKSLPGTPLYEVKLDRYQYRQTYVIMTTDAIACYENIQPLAHIDDKPTLTNLRWNRMYGYKPEDPFYKRSNVKAALKIQRAYRIFRSRKITARKRYEMWSRTVGKLVIVFYNDLLITICILT